MRRAYLYFVIMSFTQSCSFSSENSKNSEPIGHKEKPKEAQKLATKDHIKPNYLLKQHFKLKEKILLAEFKSASPKLYLLGRFFDFHRENDQFIPLDKVLRKELALLVLPKLNEEASLNKKQQDLCLALIEDARKILFDEDNQLKSVYLSNEIRHEIYEKNININSNIIKIHNSLIYSYVLNIIQDTLSLYQKDYFAENKDQARKTETFAFRQKAIQEFIIKNLE